MSPPTSVWAERWLPGQRRFYSTDQPERPLGCSDPRGWTMAPRPPLRILWLCHYPQQLHPALRRARTPAAVPSRDKGRFHQGAFWKRSGNRDCTRGFKRRCCACWVAGGGFTLQHPEGVCQRGRVCHGPDVGSECVLSKKDIGPFQPRVHADNDHLQINGAADSEGTACGNAACLLL